MPAYRHIDPALLLHAACQDVPLFLTLCQTYLDTAPAMFGQLAQAVRSGTPQAIVHGSHGLRGSVALLGATALVSRLAELERLARLQERPAPGWLDETARLLALVEAEVRRGMAEYQETQA
ncbi:MULTISPECIES: Hpt domain-containing protein [unclassified Janthinobacterium]|uniref:Hpt domain-containing protein n=1 Tax=unclassified Janthinobacterium TaxID=2610881 RepID=UPI0008F52D88|nr:MULTISPECIES: Hpt domain-containing protein [unclassified Janthinobacterium]MDN2710448.1 Hpt domain-containing protein [Janthinobacterium sp. SUN118]